MEKFRNILPLFSYVCLLLLISVMANGMLFSHAHQLENGQVITHAHPIITEEHKELPDHGHSESELLLLKLISHAQFLYQDLKISVPVQLEVPLCFFPWEIAESDFLKGLFGFDLRGPPAYT